MNFLVIKIKRSYYELIHKVSLWTLDFGFSIGWWWLVEKMIDVRKATIPKLLKIIIPKEITANPNVTVSENETYITVRSKKRPSKKIAITKK